MEINRIIDTVNAEIARRKNETTDEIAGKRNRRFAAAKAAQISEAADVARDGARQLASIFREWTRPLSVRSVLVAVGLWAWRGSGAVVAGSPGPWW